MKFPENPDVGSLPIDVRVDVRLDKADRPADALTVAIESAETARTLPLEPSSGERGLFGAHDRAHLVLRARVAINKVALAVAAARRSSSAMALAT